MNALLVQQFNEEMLSLFTKIGQATGYWPRRFLRKVREDGGYQVARDLLQPSNKAAAGFGRLAEENCLYFSVECLAQHPKWSPLFTDQERQVACSRLEKAGYCPLPEEIPATQGLIEGAVYTIHINAYERNPEARRKCIAHHGRSCLVCNFNFAAVYGPLAEGSSTFTTSSLCPRLVTNTRSILLRTCDLYALTATR
jgi:hypothetical protein